MANGRFLMSKPSGGITTVTVADGAGNTSLVLPESGTLLTTANITASNVDTTANKVLKVGDFGNGKAIHLGVVDLNQIFPCGVYQVDSGSTNTPTVGAYYVQIFESDGTTGNIQVARHATLGTSYTRVYNGSTWSVWAEICDTSEEGTFTPRIYGSTTAGVGTYSSQVGTYERLGNQIHFNIYLGTTAHTGTGTIRIDGLPYVPSLNYNAVTIGYISNFTFTGNVVAYADNTGIIYLTAHTSGAATPSGITMDPSIVIVLSGTYRIS